MARKTLLCEVGSQVYEYTGDRYAFTFSIGMVLAPRVGGKRSTAITIMGVDIGRSQVDVLYAASGRQHEHRGWLPVGRLLDFSVQRREVEREDDIEDRVTALEGQVRRLMTELGINA